VGFGNEKQYAKAIEDFSSAIQRKPDYGKAFRQRGLSYIYARDFQKAIDDLTRAIELDPSDYRYYNDRAVTFINAGDKRKAKEDYIRARDHGDLAAQSEIDNLDKMD
jgi:tetratricopeptide (TPR) repeat protein